MNSKIDPSPISTARFIAAAFAEYNAQFRATTRRAPQRFDARDWRASQRDAVERIELYDRFVNSTVAHLRERLGAAALAPEMWRAIKTEFTALIEPLPDSEFTKTFYSSISRRLFGTVGVNPDLEYIALDLDPLAGIAGQVLTNSYTNRGSLALLVEEILTDFRFRTPYRDFDRSVEYVAHEIASHCTTAAERRMVTAVEIIRPVFFQQTRAYLVGRVTGRGWQLPLAIALKNTERGVLVDAVLLAEDDVSVVFSFTRSYFHVDLERVGEAVLFLKSILPRKPVSELFTVLGRAKQGKTERYRHFFRHLGSDRGERFVHAEGERGMVMVVFTLPSYPLVFKLIRDKFAFPKESVRAEVMQKYTMVFRHDRAGRLVDAQEFRWLRFPRAQFAPALLDELLVCCSETAQLDGDDLVIAHCYVERRMRPLNLYLREADAEAARRAVVDYGQAIRDLAASNIFPGDLLLKNFGVTGHNRVIFYDYDELCLVGECRFRDLPDDDGNGSETFYVGPLDVFPEQFPRFLGMNESQRQALLEAHADIFTVRWWQDLQQAFAAGLLVDVPPYSEQVRLKAQTFDFPAGQ
ncbi:MAG: bifunctional isocitrate dehydrogenase kinase/phosphatase [Steroidobacteraceae bacterium]